MTIEARPADALRPVRIETDYTEMAAGSVLICSGRTRVLCTASVTEGVPPFLKGKGLGWLTAEYAMLPGSTPQRKARDGIKKDGRSVEIQRLIGRSLRAACDRSLLGERTIYIDCDVLQADGGTRTASITGAFVAARRRSSRASAAPSAAKPTAMPAPRASPPMKFTISCRFHETAWRRYSS